MQSLLSQSRSDLDSLRTALLESLLALPTPSAAFSQLWSIFAAALKANLFKDESRTPFFTHCLTRLKQELQKIT